MASLRATVTDPVTTVDFISLLWQVPLMLLRVITGLFQRCLPSHAQYALGLRQKLGVSFLRAVRSTLNSRQSYAFAHRALTGEQVRAYCAAKGFPHRAVSAPIPSGIVNGATGGDISAAVLHFVTLPQTSSNASGPTLFYCHGGGYLDPLLGAGHFNMVDRMAAACGARQVVFLEYTLMPYIEYPGQLIQATEAMRTLVEKEGISPSELIVGGDSAGGHLLVSLMAHLTRPCPGVPLLKLPKNDSQLRAAVLICPWLTMVGAGPIAASNAAYDYLAPDRIAVFAELLRTNPAHVWAEPVDAPDAKAVWDAAFPRGKPYEAPVRRVLVTGGASEVILENIQTFAAEHLKAESVVLVNGARDKNKKADLAVLREKQTVFALGPCEVHVQPAIDAALGYKNGSTATAMEVFLESL